MGTSIPLGWQGESGFCCSWEEFGQEIFTEKIKASGVSCQGWCWGEGTGGTNSGLAVMEACWRCPQSPGARAEAAFIHLCAHLVTWDRISQTGSQLHFCAGLFLSPLSGKTNKLFTQCFFKIIAKNQDHTSSAFRSFILPVQTCLCETLSVLFFCAVSLLFPC